MMGREWTFQAHRLEQLAKKDAPFIQPLRPMRAKYSNSCAYLGFKNWLDLPISLRSEYDYEHYNLSLKTFMLQKVDSLHNVYEYPSN